MHNTISKQVNKVVVDWYCDTLLSGDISMIGQRESTDICPEPRALSPR